MKRRISCLLGLSFLVLWMSACSQDKKIVAEGAASNWLKLVDSGNYAQSWDDTGNVLKANVAETSGKNCYCAIADRWAP